MHHLGIVMVVNLGHDSVITLNTIGNAVGKMQLIYIADFCAVEVIQTLNDLLKELCFWVMGFAGANI